MAVNKVIYGNEVLIDLTEDTVTEETLAEGYTAHGADGEMITGTMSSSSSSSSGVAISGVDPYYQDSYAAHIVENGVYKNYDGDGQIYVFEVTSGTEYMMILGCPTETFHAMFTTEDVTESDEEVSGTAIIDTNNPIYFTTARFTPSDNGYLVIEVGRWGETTSKVYVYDAQRYWGWEADE